MAAAAAGECSLSSPQELESIVKLRELLAPELGKRDAEGKNFAHLVSDTVLTRVLRGNDGSVEKSAAWYRNQLEWRGRLGLDEVYPRVHACKWLPGSIPHYQEMCTKYMTMIFGEDEYRTPAGDLIWYDSWGDAKPKQMMDEVSEDVLKEYFLSLVELRWARLDALSQESGRMVKVCRILDMEGVSVSMRDGRWGKFEKDYMQPAMMHCSAEAVAAIFIINFPSWAQGIYNVASKALPARLKNKIRVLGADFQSNPEFLTMVGPSMIAKCQAQRKLSYADTTSMSGSGRVLPAGGIMERIIPVDPGCQVLWNFRIGTEADASEASRGMLGKAMDVASGESTDVLFQVKFMPHLEDVMKVDEIKEGDRVNWDEQVVDVVPPTTVDATMGQLDGKTVTDRSGLIMVSWSNQSSWVRGRVLASYQLIVNRPDDDVGSFHSGDD